MKWKIYREYANMSTPFPMQSDISILIAKSQTAVQDHLDRAGWKPTWRLGEPTKSYPQGEPMDDGKIEGRNARIVRIRSAEIPWQISRGRDEKGMGFDIGLVGTDCFVDHPLENMYVMGAYLYGRDFNGNQPHLSLFVNEKSPIRSKEDLLKFRIGAYMTERPHLGQADLDADKIPSAVYWNDEGGGNYEQFAAKVNAEGKVPIKIIEGAGAQQLIRENDVLAMISETGRRERNHSLREISRICDIETLALVNVNSYEDKVKRRGIDMIIRDLDRVAMSLETEGISNPKESLLVKAGKER